MEIKDYKAPRAMVIEVNVQGVLCQSGMYEKELDPNDFEQQ